MLKACVLSLILFLLHEEIRLLLYVASSVSNCCFKITSSQDHYFMQGTSLLREKSCFKYCFHSSGFVLKEVK